MYRQPVGATTKSVVVHDFVKIVGLTCLLPNHAEKELLRNRVNAVHIDHVSAEPDLGEHIFSVRELADRDLPRSELAGAEEQADGELAHAIRSKAGLAERNEQANAELADRDEADGKLADGDHTTRDATDRDDAMRRNAPTGLRADAVGVMNERQPADIEI